MITEMRTHVVSSDGTHCGRCGVRLTDSFNAPRGQRMGRIVAEHGGTHVYRIGEHDSNQMCGEVAK